MRGYVPAADLRESRPTSRDAVTLAEAKIAARSLGEALEFARAAVKLDPASEDARAALIALGPRAHHTGRERPLARLAAIWPGAPVTPGGEGWVWAPAASVREFAADGAPSRGVLPLGAPVRVLAVEGRAARVSGAVVHDPRTKLDLGPLRASSQAAPSVEVWMDAASLTGEERGAEAVAQESRARSSRGAVEDAVALAHAAYSLAPARRDLADLLVEAALRAKRYGLAADVALATDRPREAADLLLIDVTLLYGCRGDPLRAVDVGGAAAQRAFTASNAPPWEKRPPRDPIALSAADFTGPDGSALRTLPANACLTEMDELGPFAVESACAHQAHPDVSAEEANRYEADWHVYGERFEAWKAAVGRIFPPKPRLRVRITNTTAAHVPPATPPFAYGYSYELEGNIEVERGVETRPRDVVPLPSPLVAPGGSVEYWLQVEGYAGSVYGVVAAPDLAAARAKVEALPVPGAPAPAGAGGGEPRPPASDANPWETSTPSVTRLSCTL